tara:strand:- start:310 stop:435 length:126 start_codon:yes stop_codon:yes gene_type:complete
MRKKIKKASIIKIFKFMAKFPKISEIGIIEKVKLIDLVNMY